MLTDSATKSQIDAYERGAVIKWLRREAARQMNICLHELSDDRPQAKVALSRAALLFSQAASELEDGEYLKVPLP